MAPVAGRRLAILADEHFDFHFGKTAMGILRYRPESVVTVIERALAGQTTGEAVGLGGDTPIVATLDDALKFSPDTLLIGVATRGGTIPPEWRPVLLQAVECGLDLMSGLHEFLGDDPRLSNAAQQAGRELIDVRRPPHDFDVAAGLPHRLGSTVITFVGSDCAVGKMSVALDIRADLAGRGLNTGFVATGQTGMMIEGSGVPLDRIMGDFMSGAIESEVNRVAAQCDVVLVEGQGSLLHPAYSGVTLALLHGSRPDGIILVVKPSRSTIEDYPVTIPPIKQLIDIHETAAAWISPAPVIGIAVNSLDLTADQSDSAIMSIASETGLPVTDTFRCGAGILADSVRRFHELRSHAPSGAESL